MFNLENKARQAGYISIFEFEKERWIKKCLFSTDYVWRLCVSDHEIKTFFNSENTIGLGRLGCLLAIHEDKKFIGSNRELLQIIKYIKAPCDNDGFQELFFEIACRLNISGREIDRAKSGKKCAMYAQSLNQALDIIINGPNSKTYIGALAIELIPDLRDYRYPKIWKYRNQIEYKNWLKKISECVCKKSDDLLFLQNLVAIAQEKPENIEPTKGHIWSNFIQALKQLSHINLSAELSIQSVISEIQKFKQWETEKALKKILPAKSLSGLVTNACICLLNSRLIPLIKTKQWENFDQILLEIRRMLTSDEWDNFLDRKSDSIKSILSEKNIEWIKLDNNQARILASLANTIRVTARAGSGKTRLLVALTFFLVDQYGCAPEEILLLAFNRNAAAQLEERLINLLKIQKFPCARTFHSLAHGIAQPEESLVFDQGEDVATRKLSILVQDILRNLLDDNLRSDVYELFRRESAEAKDTGAFLVGQAAYNFRRALDQFTLGGEAVKSRGEKFIGDFLFEHGLKFYYETPIRRGITWYRPDFKIMTDDKNYIIWEHWAIAPEAEYSSFVHDWSEHALKKYQTEAREKKEYWRTKGISLIESCAQTCGDREVFETEIAVKLRPYFPNLTRLSLEERLARMQEVHLSRLGGWLGQAMQRTQKRGWDAATLHRELAAYRVATKREQLFLTLLEKVFSVYESRLDTEKKIDFDRLFNRAIAMMKADPPHSILGGKKAQIELKKLRYCLVDEAQDLSPQFIEAVACLRKMNPRLKLVFVGDDWQAINRFAGSEVELFTEGLLTRFGKCATPTLATNYRSVSKVVQAGNSLMQGQGAEAKPNKKDSGCIQLVYLDKVWVEFRKESSGWEEDRVFRDCGQGVEAFFKSLYQLAITDLLSGKTIGVLFRTNHYAGKKLPELEKKFVQLLISIGWPREQVTEWQKKKIRFSTAHSYKGAESQTIFIVNPRTGSFPLLNADSIELFRFFGDSLEQAEADERRLFYVAITRAEERLIFLIETHCEDDSPYLNPFRNLIQTITIPSQLIVPEPDYDTSQRLNIADKRIHSIA